MELRKEETLDKKMKRTYQNFQIGVVEESQVFKSINPFSRRNLGMNQKMDVKFVNQV